MTQPIDDLPDDLESLKRLLAAEHAARTDAEAKAASAGAAAARAAANVSSAEALIAHLKLAIEKMRRELYGSHSERRRKLVESQVLDQMEFELEDLEAAAAEDELAAEMAAAKTGGETTLVSEHARRKPVCKPVPAHLPRERVTVPAPAACACRGSTRLSKLGEDVTETLEVIPRQWKVVQHVREEFTCRACEKISQAPAPFHVLPRGFAGPSLVAMILFEKYGQHRPLNRRSERYAGEGVDLSLSTLADQVGACATALRPFRLLQADAYDGYNRLYLPDRKPGPITEALCWSHARRKFFELADIAANARRGKDAPPISPIAFEAVKRIDMLFDIEREINGLSAEQRLAAREERSAPLVDALEEWMRAERVRLSRHASVAKPIDYMLKRWPAFTGFRRDGQICLSNNAAERALRGLALGRKSWHFAGSERGAERAAVVYTLIQTAKLNDVDPQAWLADVLRRINDQPVSKLDELLPWNWWKHPADQAVAA